MASFHVRRRLGFWAVVFEMVLLVYFWGLGYLGKFIGTKCLFLTLGIGNANELKRIFLCMFSLVFFIECMCLCMCFGSEG